jgi:hypothetical protein
MQGRGVFTQLTSSFRLHSFLKLADYAPEVANEKNAEFSRITGLVSGHGIEFYCLG